MARPLDVALAEDAIVSEGGSRLPARGCERVLELGRAANDSHAAPAAARRGLDDERIADVVGLPVWHDGHTGLAGDLLRGELVAALPQCVGRRPHERDTGSLHRLRELGALREEAVAGMDGVRRRLARGLHDRGGVEVALDLQHPVGGRARGAPRDRRAPPRRSSRSRAAGTCGRSARRSRLGSRRAAASCASHHRQCRQAAAGEQQVGDGVGRCAGERASHRGARRLARCPREVREREAPGDVEADPL